jgi:hypothetical protein
MQLSIHFSLEELIASDKAKSLAINNVPPDFIVERLKTTAAHMEEVRDILRSPVLVSSAYRCLLLNAAVGSKPTSDHPQGYAVDFTSPAFGGPIKVARELVAHLSGWDQIIYEGTWVHISFNPRMRRQVLTKRGDGYLPGLVEK